MKPGRRRGSSSKVIDQGVIQTTYTPVAPLKRVKTSQKTKSQSALSAEFVTEESSEDETITGNAASSSRQDSITAVTIDSNPQTSWPDSQPNDQVAATLASQMASANVEVTFSGFNDAVFSFDSNMNTLFDNGSENLGSQVNSGVVGGTSASNETSFGLDYDFGGIDDQELQSMEDNESIKSIDDNELMIDKAVTSSQPETFMIEAIEKDQAEVEDLNSDDEFYSEDEEEVIVHNVLENYMYYRAYNVSVFASPNPKASTQIDIMKDFKVGPSKEIVLNPKKFAVVTIQRVLLNGYAQLVPSCSLCKTKFQFTFYYIERDIKDANVTLPIFYSCRHIYAAAARLLHYHHTEDNIDYQSPYFGSELYKSLASKLTEEDPMLIPGSWYCDELITHQTKKGKISLYLTDFYTFILVSNVKLSTGRYFLYCYDCRPRYSGCHHSRLITLEMKYALGTIDNQESTQRRPAVRRNLNRISYKRYPYDVRRDNNLAREIVVRQCEGLVQWMQEHNTNELPRKPIDCCGVRAIKYSAPRTRWLLHVDIYNYSCSLCDKVYVYDGREDGIINFANSKLITVEFFYEMLQFKYHAGVPTTAFWKCKLNTTLLALDDGNPNKQRMETYWLNLSGQMNQMMVEFIEMIDYGPLIFNCCPSPRIVCIDGIVLSVASSRIREMDLKTPWVQETRTNVRFSNRQYRNVCHFKKKADRAIIRSFIHEDIAHLNEVYKANPIIEFISLANVRNANGTVSCVPLLREFYHCIYQLISPASGMAPVSTWIIIKAIISQNHITFEQQIALQAHSPPLGFLALYLLKEKANNAIFKKGLHIFALVLNKAAHNYKAQSDKYTDMIEDIPVEEQTDITCWDDVKKTGHFFPKFKVVRKLKRLDLIKEDAVCNKDYKQAGRLGAGTLLFWCAEHRCCLGYVILTSAESVRHVYEVLVSRFPVMPSVIIYDNACNLHEYSLNRDPRLFLNTMFFSDGFHIENHINCMMTYNPNIYEFLEEICSVLHEQKNAVLDRLKETSPLMRYDTFVAIMTHILHSMNVVEQEKTIRLIQNQIQDIFWKSAPYLAFPKRNQGITHTITISRKEKMRKESRSIESANVDLLFFTIQMISLNPVEEMRLLKADCCNILKELQRERKKEELKQGREIKPCRIEKKVTAICKRHRKSPVTCSDEDE